MLKFVSIPLALFLAFCAFQGMGDLAIADHNRGHCVDGQGEAIPQDPRLPAEWDGWCSQFLSEDFLRYIGCIVAAGKLDVTMSREVIGNVTYVTNRPLFTQARAYSLCALDFPPAATVSQLGHLMFLDAELAKPFPGVPDGWYTVAWGGAIETVQVGSARDAQISSMR